MAPLPIPPEMITAFLQQGGAQGLAGIGQSAGQMGMKARGMAPKGFDLGGGPVREMQKDRMRQQHMTAIQAMLGG